MIHCASGSSNAPLHFSPAKAPAIAYEIKICELCGGNFVREIMLSACFRRRDCDRCVRKELERQLRDSRMSNPKYQAGPYIVGPTLAGVHPGSPQ